MEINSENTITAWKKALKHIKEYGKDFKDKDNRLCRECLNLTINIANIQDSERPIDIMQDFEWIYPTKEELENIVFNKEDQSVYEYSYGPRIFRFNGKIDQINDYIVPLLKSDPNSRRAVLNIFDPSTDANPLSKNIPSMMFMHFKIVDGKLNASGFIRSNDFFIGFPGNIYQISKIQKYIAEKILVGIGITTIFSCSAHIFHEHFAMIEKVISK